MCKGVNEKRYKYMYPTIIRMWNLYGKKFIPKYLRASLFGNCSHCAQILQGK